MRVRGSYGIGIVHLPSVGPPSFNVAVAGSLVMYDRLLRQQGVRA